MLIRERDNEASSQPDSSLDVQSCSTTSDTTLDVQSCSITSDTTFDVQFCSTPSSSSAREQAKKSKGEQAVVDAITALLQPSPQKEQITTHSRRIHVSRCITSDEYIAEKKRMEEEKAKKAAKPKKRKGARVEMSSGEEDEAYVDDPDTPPPKKTRRKKRKADQVKIYTSSEEENEDYDDYVDEPPPPKKTETRKRKANQVEMSSEKELVDSEIEELDYVIVRFPVSQNNRDRLWIGQVLKKEKRSVTVKFLRKKVSEKFGAIFTYPITDDTMSVNHSQIKRKVKINYIKRGVHVFHLTDDEIKVVE
ncbi:uncharacterized protein LOC109860587 [Pseudomyrmex gracilis]|nr:uncharacterized protein LOC109860587 [Pseudomyrmex gracilis]